MEQRIFWTLKINVINIPHKLRISNFTIFAPVVLEVKLTDK